MKKKAPGTIEKRGGSSWRVGFQVQTEAGWRWVRKTVQISPALPEARQRQAAELELARLRVAYEDGQVKPSEGQTVRQFSEYWMQQAVLPTMKATTAAGHRYMLDSRILPALGDVPLHRLTPIRINEWLNDLRRSPVRSQRLPDDQLAHPRRPSEQARIDATADDAPRTISERTVQHYYDTLFSMLDQAVRWHMLRDNPMDGVRRPHPRKSHIKYLSEEDAARLVEALLDEDRLAVKTAILLALLCGLRLGEVGALKLSDVDWARGTIDVSHALKYTPASGSYEDVPKTESSERVIALPQLVMELLEQVREEDAYNRATFGDLWRGEGYIVHGWDGRRLHHDTPSKWFRQFADAHGFEGITFHGLRHSQATILLANNIDPVAVAYRLGHSSADTTLRIYAHALRRRDDDAAEALDALFNGIGTGSADAGPSDIAPASSAPAAGAPADAAATDQSDADRDPGAPVYPG